jgi:hypothetical protein
MLASSCRDAYLARGFAISEPIVDDGYLVRIGEAVDALHRRALAGEPELASICVFEKELPAKKRGGVEVAPSQNAVFILGDPSRFDPLFLSVFAQDALIAMVKDLLQAREVVIHFANITTKSPSIGSGISWHRDFPNQYICPETPQTVRTMICIDGMGDDNGATQFVPGTHLDAEVEGKTISPMTAASSPRAAVRGPSSPFILSSCTEVCPISRTGSGVTSSSNGASAACRSSPAPGNPSPVSAMRSSSSAPDERHRPRMQARVSPSPAPSSSPAWGWSSSADRAGILRRCHRAARA